MKVNMAVRKAMRCTVGLGTTASIDGQLMASKLMSHKEGVAEFLLVGVHCTGSTSPIVGEKVGLTIRQLTNP